MTTLSSPGVQTSIIDESFYTSAAPGTVPMIFVASASNKSNASATGTAAGTLDSNLGKVWTITSQRDLTDTFGTPLFYTDSGSNPINGGEQNEYGLQAAYSLLGVSSRVYVARAPVDLGQLSPVATVPEGAPAAGTYWLESNNSLYGVGQWDSSTQTFITQTPLIIDNDNKASVADSTTTQGVTVWTPKAGFGTKGSYAMVVTSENTNQLWFKNSTRWVLVGSDIESTFTANGFTSSCWQTSWPVATSSVSATGLLASLTAGGDTKFSINGQAIIFSNVSTVAALVTAINTTMVSWGVGAAVIADRICLFADATAKSDGVHPDGKLTLTNGTMTVASMGFVAQTYGAISLAIQSHTQYPDFAAELIPTGSVYVKTTTPNSGANWVVMYYNAATQTWGTVNAPIYPDTATAINSIDAAGGKNIVAGTLFVESNYDGGPGTNPLYPKLAEFKIHRRVNTSPTTIQVTTSTILLVDSNFSIMETLAGSSSYSAPVTVTLFAGMTTSQIATQIAITSGLTNITSSYDSTSGVFSISHALGGDFKLYDGVHSPLSVLGISAATAYNPATMSGIANLYTTGLHEVNGPGLRASNWKPLVYESKSTAPTTIPADGQLWYSSIVDEADIMINNGTAWVGYKNYNFGNGAGMTDPNGPMIAALAPTTQSDGTPLQTGDIWISTADIDLYGQSIYVWNNSTLKWIAQDTTDQTTPNGWVFADARWATTGTASAPSSIVSLLSSNYLDPDAPDPALYPKGMKLWNLRRSGFNIKKYVTNYINVYSNNGLNARYNNEVMDTFGASYFADRWVTVSPNQETGAGSFGRHAQRGFVVAAMKSLIDTNQSIRDRDMLVFNLIAAPGYPEAIQNMIAFNVDRGLTAFVVGDTPFRLAPSGTSLANWGNNAALAFDNGEDGAVSYSDYMGMFYPSGFTNDNNGNNIVVPPSHMILRTIANSDAKSYPWFAPAGTRRGGIDNATSVGYLLNGEFTTVSLHNSLRDVLAGVKINPIATFPGSGLVNFGNYTRAPSASALDRINVARLVCYLNRQLDILARPFLFEPNDQITRNEIKAAVESLMLELVGQRALYDFIVVCDTSNNTTARIDRSELWLDIAIEPVKAVEFIYIPMRLKNTGAIKAGL